MKISKRNQAIDWLTSHSVPWQCLHCDQGLSLQDQSLSCPNGHRFDLSRQGYVNLSQTNHPSHYDQDLFVLRREIILNSPFYAILHQHLRKLVEESSLQRVLDAGCGEGSHLHHLSQVLAPSVTLIGVDIAKEGIQLATDFNQSQFSLVADLAQLPFQAQTFDLILSILSPANYEEFHRVLKDTGRLIKVIPNSTYLQELRIAIARILNQPEEIYSNQDVEAVFRSHFSSVNYYDLHQVVPLTLTQRQQLIQMTPLTWRLSDAQKIDLLADLPSEITLDLRILVGEKINFLG